jgi:putative tryptophan/tyrosine transport system substrate-binding protein
MRRRDFIVLLGGAVIAWPPLGRAQPVRSTPKVGWLKIQGPQHTPGQLQAFRDGMRELGLIEGRDFVLEERYANDDDARLPGLATDLVGAGVSVILATSQPSIAAAEKVTKTVPIIGRMVDDPVVSGMAQSLGRPGGNVTGIYSMAEELNPKRLALLKDAVPSLRSVGVLLRSDFPSKDIAAHDWQVGAEAARQLGLELVPLDARTSEGITSAFEQAEKSHVGGIMTFRNPTVVTYTDLIAKLCRQYRLPAVFDAREYVDAGGLMSYGPNIDAIYRQLAAYVAKLLRGTTPGELPIQQPTAFELVINKGAADAIGVAIPQSLLATADKIVQ